MSGTSFSNRVDTLRADGRRYTRNSTLDSIRHKYRFCPHCKKSMRRDEECPNCHWSGKEGFK